MKRKLILLACISITIASCKKNEAELVQPQTPTLSTEQQVADLIQRADRNLYDEVYNQDNQRASGVDVRIIHGVFVAQFGDITAGTCLPHATNPCMVIVTAGPAVGSPGGGVGNNASLQFPESDPAKLIVNTSQPSVQNITELSTSSNSNGSITVTYQ